MSPRPRSRLTETAAAEKRAVVMNGLSTWLAILGCIVGVIVYVYWR